MALLPRSTKNPKPQNTQIQDDLNLVFSFSCTDVARKPRPTSLTVICVCFHQTSTNLSWEKCLPSFKTENEKKVTESDASKWCSFLDLLEPLWLEVQKKVHILQNTVKYMKVFWDNTQQAPELLGSHCMCREGRHKLKSLLIVLSFSFVLPWNFNRFLKIHLHHHSGSSQNPAELYPFF